jgi:outer membrane biogenesis lipoprotein LolB
METQMRVPAAGVFLVAAAILAGCASPVMVPDPAHPLALGDGSGSQFGNYAARVEIAASGPEGGGCTVYVWDRPLSKDYALRLTSESCPSAHNPGRMESREVSRTLVPLSQSLAPAP